MELSLKKLSDINRMLGVIEGAAMCAPPDIGNVICNMTQAIDEVLNEAAEE